MLSTPLESVPISIITWSYGNGTYLSGCTPGVFDPRYAVNPSLEARLRHPCRRRPRIEHTGLRKSRQWR
jgi:hypothetical protein